jgi:hypothetical protein
MATTMVWSPLGATFACWLSEALVVMDCISKWEQAFRRRGVIHEAIACAIYM